MFKLFLQETSSMLKLLKSYGMQQAPHQLHLETELPL